MDYYAAFAGLMFLTGLCSGWLIRAQTAEHDRRELQASVNRLMDQKAEVEQELIQALECNYLVKREYR